MKDVVGCDKLRGVTKQTVNRRCPNGAILPRKWKSMTEYIGHGSEPWELKHLSTRRNRNQ